jgi:serine/threonine-protein kinase
MAMPGPQDDRAHDEAIWRRWDEVDRLFEAALDKAPAERDTFLAAATAGDNELLRLLRELLDLSETAHGRLERPGNALLNAVWSSDTDNADTRPPVRPGEVIGAYRIVAEIGRGGMATVYEAERADGAFEQRVALKVLRRGIDTEDVVRRFLAERQILAGLMHPNIARLLDGGATGDGRPYLVMDRVEGEPITMWADRRKRGIGDRLLLFLQVADAVAYAHQRLVVHRDIKPSNILVTNEGRAKLLDFGIARLLDADADGTRLTRAGQRLLTPEYASPEQLRADAITTASDVYQLGLLLHVMLVGTRPHNRTGPTAQAAPGTGDVLRPSTALSRSRELLASRATTLHALQRSLRGDLDTIVLKALREEPDQRYASVQAMAADVRRHLDGLPIEARRPSAHYRLRKFAGRNRWFAPVAALVLVGLFGFGFTRLRHERQLERERNEARAQAERALLLKGFLVGLFDSADPYAPADPERGRAITVVEALALGADRARGELAEEPVLRADLLSSIASVYESLDQNEPALRLLQEVLEIRHHQETASSTQSLDELGRYANMLALIGLPDSAAATFRHRLDLERELHGLDHVRVADALMGYAHHLSNRGDLQGALELREEAVWILRADQPAHRSELGDVLGSIADTYRELQRPVEAESAARESLDIHRELFGDDNANTAMARVHLAQVHHALGDLNAAIELYREALDVLDRTLGPEHRNTVASRNNFGIVLMDAEDFVGAEQVHRRMLELRQRLSGDNGDGGVAASLQNLSATLIRQGRFAEAESLSWRAHGIYLQTTPAGHYLQAFPLLTIAESRLLQGDGAGAERAARSAVEILRSSLPPDHYATAAAECRIGAALVRQGRTSQAEPLVHRSLEVLEANAQSPARLVRECASTRAALDSAGLRR